MTVNASHKPSHARDDRWMARGRCRNLDVSVDFYAYEHQHDERYLAKQVCLACPVQSECLEYALTNGETLGIWGGLTSRQRKRLQRLP